MSSRELISILSKQWANIDDIKIIGACGRDKATLIRNDIIKEIKNDGYNLPIGKQKIVPMKNVIEYFNINIDYIYSMANREKNYIKGGI